MQTAHTDTRARRVSGGRGKARTAGLVLSGVLLLGACGGGANVVVEVQPGDAYRLAEATIVRAEKKAEIPTIEELHAAFEVERERTSLPEHWNLADLDESHLEVQLMLPEDTGTAEGLSEGVFASEEETTTTSPEAHTSESAPAEGASESAVAEDGNATSTESSVSGEESKTKTAETTTTTEPVVMKVATAACIIKGEHGWESSSEACEIEESGHTDAHTPTTAGGAHTSAHWSYDGESGPNHWGELDEAYKTCVDGSAQTPIDIVGKDTVKGDLKDPMVSYAPGKAVVTNNGHTIQFAAASGSLTVENMAFPFLQMHFHASSEHTIDNKHWPVEVHFVHKREDGKIAVIGVMLEEGTKENEAWKPLVDSLGVAEGATSEIDVDWSALLPTGKASYRYAGSLTTPPCSEGVSWVVMQQPVQISKAQIEAFQKAYDHNNRPVQPIGSRVVTNDQQDK